MKTLLIDNYDSFTHNLYHYAAEVNGQNPDIVRNDEVSIADVLGGGYDGIIISPGPGTPANPADIGVCRAVLLQSKIPVLGVCLGHQALCHAYGGRVDYAPVQMHGRISQVLHKGCDILQGIPSPFAVVRYHSLIARDPPACLEVTGWTEDGIIMALRHRTRPIWSVQFHPESICTEHGKELLANFRDLSLRFWEKQRLRPAVVKQHARNGKPLSAHTNGHPAPLPNPATNRPACAVRFQKLDCFPDAEATFVNLFGESERSFWLDSSLEVPGLSRYSFMGACEGESGEMVAYDVSTGKLRIRRGGREIIRTESIFEYLNHRTANLRVAENDLPFPFPGGYVGYLGYELKSECGASTVYQHRSSTPDAMFLLAGRFLVFDHAERAAYLVFVEGVAEGDAASWFEETARRLHSLNPLAPLPRKSDAPPVDVRLRHSPSEYLALIDECLAEIREGNSYEVCLTNQISVQARIDPLVCYRLLRQINPAPYAAYLRFPEVTVISASPERFLTVDKSRWVESKPIKGTLSRGRTPEDDAVLKARLQSSEKDRAENLMIVDLLRNDLGIVCEVGSVHVPKLFDVESFATVHQLVSTIRGRLRMGLSAVDCVRAAFPGGSMTGAPKKRTMEIIDRLEDGPRGVYSGAIGYFGLDGAADLNIVIRTIVVAGDEITLGVGGAIVTLSDPESELEETYLKGQASLQALRRILPHADALPAALDEPVRTRT